MGAQYAKLHDMPPLTATFCLNCRTVCHNPTADKSLCSLVVMAGFVTIDCGWWMTSKGQSTCGDRLS
jgi:hypothetical protein